VKDFSLNTSMSLVGVSHSASEFLIKKTVMKDWFNEQFSLPSTLLPQEKWWL
jgi:hypothetical protein